MKTYLLFKRQETTEGVTKVVTKVVPVDIPQIASGEGWILSGHTDIIDILPDSSPEIASTTGTQLSIDEIPEDVRAKFEKLENTVKEPDLTKFISDVQGTAKLVRSKGAIKIVARRGKSTYNQTTPNSVCIDDYTKNNFFKDCRAIHGNNGCYEFTDKDGRPYDYWNDIIDKEYMRQKKKATSTT